MDNKPKIVLDANKHLKSVHFDLNETCIKDIDEWLEIPKIVIITGRNGLGKTQLFNYIHNYAKIKKVDTKIIFQNAIYDREVLNNDETEQWYKDKKKSLSVHMLH